MITADTPGAALQPTAYIYDPLYLTHDTGSHHVERPERLLAIKAAFARYGLVQEDGYLAPPAATLEQLARVQDRAYIRRVEQIAAGGGRWMDPDTNISAYSWAAAVRSAGGAVLGADLLLRGEQRSVFALIRPPGHHANAGHAMGFCIFNNAAVAAAHAMAEYGLERVLIVDWDVHHGNGTQDIFYSDPRVLYFSTHEYPFYPGSGGADEIGAGAGRGYTLNVPLPHHVGNAGYLQAYHALLLPAAARFQPQLVIVSAGYDAHHTDPIAYMKLDAQGYYQMAAIVKQIADLYCGGRVLVLLEGGYNLNGIAESAAATCFALDAQPLPAEIVSEQYIDSFRYDPVWYEGTPDVGDLLAEIRRLHNL